MSQWKTNRGTKKHFKVPSVIIMKNLSREAGYNDDPHSRHFNTIMVGKQFRKAITEEKILALYHELAHAYLGHRDTDPKGIRHQQEIDAERLAVRWTLNLIGIGRWMEMDNHIYSRKGVPERVYLEEIRRAAKKQGVNLT